MYELITLAFSDVSHFRQIVDLTCENEKWWNKKSGSIYANLGLPRIDKSFDFLSSVFSLLWLQLVWSGNKLN